MRWLRFAARNVLRNRRRSLVTVLIAAVGAAGVLVGGGFALYTYESLREMTAREVGHLVVAHRDFFGGDEDVPLQLGLDDFRALAERLEQDPRVRRALPRLQFSGLLSNGEKSAVFTGTGVDPEGELAVRGPSLECLAGALLGRPAAGGPAEIVLGKELARQLRAAPGSALTLLATTTSGSLNALDVVVRGVVTVGVPELDRRLVQTDVATAQRLLATDRVSSVSVFLRETERTDELRAEVAAALPDRAVRTWRDQAHFYAAVHALYDRIFGLLGAVIAVMVAFAVSNTLGMAVVERTREIGTLRAVGTLPSQIVRTFALEGLVLGAVGSALGALLAAGLTALLLVVDVQMPPPPGRSVGYPLQIAFSPALYLATALALTALSVAAAFAASRKAAERPIVEALAHV